MRRSDLAYVLVVLAILGGSFAVDRAVSSKPPPDDVIGSGRFVSIGWYCPAPEGLDAEMASTNVGNEPVRLRRGTAGGAKASVVEESELGVSRRSSVVLSKFGIPSAVGLVEAFGADTASDLVVIGQGSGAAAARCSVQPWDRWFFATAGSARGRDHHLLVANPFQEEAIVKVRVMGPESDMVPARLKDLVIPAQTQLPVFLSEYVPETASFGLEVSATTGRVIVSRYSKAASRDGVKGISVTLGERGPSDRWVFAGGEVPVDGEETIAVVNPTEQEALIQVIFPTENEQLAPPELAEIRVPAGRQISINVAQYLPRGTRHSTIVLATNGVRLVAERQTIAAVDGGRGYEITFGSPRLAKKWIAGVGSSAGGQASIALVNAGRTRAIVRVVLIVEDREIRLGELAALDVAPDRRVTVDLTPHLGGKPATAVIESLSGEIGVERYLLLGPPYADFASAPALALD